jgi:hypothetical protein
VRTAQYSSLLLSTGLGEINIHSGVKHTRLRRAKRLAAFVEVLYIDSAQGLQHVLPDLVESGAPQTEGHLYGQKTSSHRKRRLHSRTVHDV